MYFAIWQYEQVNRCFMQVPLSSVCINWVWPRDIQDERQSRDISHPLRRLSDSGQPTTAALQPKRSLHADLDFPSVAFSDELVETSGPTVRWLTPYAVMHSRSLPSIFSHWLSVVPTGTSTWKEATMTLNIKCHAWWFNKFMCRRSSLLRKLPDV